MFLFLLGQYPGVGLLWHMINMQEFVINFVKNGPVVVLSGQVIFYLYQQYITDIYWVFFVLLLFLVLLVYLKNNSF